MTFVIQQCLCASLDPSPSDLCIPMEGLVRDDHVGTLGVGSPQSHHDNDLQPPGIFVWSEVKRLANDC